MKQRPDLQQFLNAQRQFAGRVPGLQSTNPLIRILSWMAMIVLIGISVVVGIVLLLVLMVAGLGLALYFRLRALFTGGSRTGRQAQPDPRRAARPEPSSDAPGQIIEGDFEVVRRKPAD